MNKNKNEKNILGKSYINSFFSEVEILTNNYCQYLSLLIELENMYKSLDENKMSEEHFNILKTVIQNFRSYAIKTNISYNSLIIITNNKEDNKDLKISFENIKKNFIIKRDDAEKYVQEINNFLSTEIMQDFLIKSSDYINSIYQDKEKLENDGD